MRNIPNNIIKYKTDKLGVLNFFIKNKRKIIICLFVISYVLLYLLVDFSSQSLVAHDEGLYARRARLIEETNNWFASPFESPHHKTLGSYWFIALSIRSFGNSELALRLPSIVASFLCLFISYLIAIKLSNKQSALISLFSLSSMPLWIQYSRYASPDLPFVLCIQLVILFFLKFLDASQYINKYFYIFISALFLSSSFFIRSYMAFVPLIGLSPFFVYHLVRSKNIFKTLFFSGILVGSFPTILNLYYSYQKFGLIGITSLFDFAKKQAMDGVPFTNVFLIPLNYIYLTFPIGILLVFLFVFTRSNRSVRYPLLIYWYPFLSLLILLCMSTSYPHYYLYLLPPLSILFSIKLNSYSFKNSFSKGSIKFLLFLLIIFICCILVFIPIYYNYLIIDYPYSTTLYVYFVFFLLLLSYVSSLRYLYDSRSFRFNLFKFFVNIAIPQYISLSLLYNFGILGNPNFKTKSFLNDKDVSLIIRSNTIYLYSVDSKIQTLLSYYLPSSKVIDDFEDIKRNDYIITSDINTFKDKTLFGSIKIIDNLFLLTNINK